MNKSEPVIEAAATLPAEHSWRGATLRAAWSYPVTFSVSLLTLCWVLRLWRANWRIPFFYWGDALFYHTAIKGITEHGWYLNNPSLGAPFGTTFYDFPIPDNFNFLILKFLTIFTTDPALILNTFYALTFPAIACLSLYAFRKLRLSVPTSMLLSLLHAFLPYHFYRNEGHLFWSAYYSIPLVTPIILGVFTGEVFLRPAPSGITPSWVLTKRELVSTLLICLVVASSGWGYYPIFTCFFLLFAGLWSAFHYRHPRYFFPALFLAAAIAGTLVLNLTPNYLYQYRHGANKIVARNPATAEVYGLKLTQMLLPVTGHRLPALAAFKDRYNRQSPLVNENDSATLGVIIGSGFLISLGCFFYRRRLLKFVKDESVSLLELLSLANMSALLLAMIGGFGSLFAWLVFSQIRAYNRISVFIAFFSALSLGICLDKVYVRIRTSLTKRQMWYGALVLLFMIGIADQTTDQFIPNYKSTKAEFENDRMFVNSIETNLPSGAKVFQLPYLEFPEPQTSSQIGLYDSFRGYLHSHAIRWSYGAMKGGSEDLWIKDVAAKSPDEMVKTLTLAGFSGIYIDRQGYDDHGAKIESQLAQLSGRQPIVSTNNRFAFYNLTDAINQLNTKYNSEELAALRHEALYPVVVKWVQGFYDLEQGANENWRWGSSEGELFLTNLSESPRRVEVKMTFASGYPTPSNLTLSSSTFQDELNINDAGQGYVRQWVVPPGGLSVKFVSRARRVEAPADPRLLVFKVVNFKMRNLD